MVIKELERLTIKDRLEGWELVEFLQIPVEDVLDSALENDWINEDNIDEVREYIGLNKGD